MNGNEIKDSEDVDLNETINNFGDAVKYLASYCKYVEIRKDKNNGIRVEGKNCGCRVSDYGRLRQEGDL